MARLINFYHYSQFTKSLVQDYFVLLNILEGAVVVGIVYGSWIYKLPMRSVPITTKVVNLNPAQGEMYSLQHYVIKFVSDLRQVGGSLRVLGFPPPIKLTTL